MTLHDLLPPLAGQVESVAGQILDYALLLAAIGTLTMALLELLKGVFFARKFFHRWYVERWLAAASHPEETRTELLALAAGGAGNANVLYDQPTAKMMGQIQAAANVALDFPDRYPRLYALLAATPGGGDDQKHWREFSEKRMNGRARRTAGKDDAEARQALQARARLGNLVARKLDALQNRMEHDWARLNQTVAIVGGGAILGMLLSSVQPAMPLESLVVVSVLGGMVAPFAKDVVSALTGLRARRA